MKNLFSPSRLDVLSQMFTNLAAGWLGVVLIIPGVTKLETFEDFLWLTKNLLFSILSLLIAMILSEKEKKINEF